MSSEPSPPSSSPPSPDTFQYQHRFRLNAPPTYSQRMVDTRSRLRTLIRAKLREITAQPKAQMRYTRSSYMRGVVGKYHVRIEGWPLDVVPFKNLSDVPNLATLELLISGFEDGTIRFRAISESEYQQMLADPSPWIGPEN